MIDDFKGAKIACCHAYGKRQIQVESYQNGKWGGKKHFKTILMDKTGEKILFFGRSNWRKKKGNLGHVVQIHICRQTVSNDQPANVDRVFPQNTSAFAG